ncbi:MAG: HAD family hydrolase [Clostridiales bacterium]|nr:HAD family hydrolase [Clostridiales bacterium]
MQLKKPKMITFDYGHTLIYEKGFSTLRGNEELMKYASKNPKGVSAKEASEFNNKLFSEIAVDFHKNDREIHHFHFQRLVNELLQMEFSLPMEEQELLFWNAASPAEKMEQVDEVLERLHELGIRTGVISNLSFSERSLAMRIGQYLPNNRFEFFTASSEYSVRKPHPLIFAVSLAKAGLQAHEVWHCGDNSRCDVEGASAAGIFPVWYMSDLPNLYVDKIYSGTPRCTHLKVSSWGEFMEKLDEME